MATLAAAIIVGKNESFELRRLLTSIQGDLFDEICVTTTQEDVEVQGVARELATKVSHFAWINDFAAARNFSFQQATTSHIMWLDSDDVIKPDNYAKLLELKSSLDSLDMVLMSYNYGHDDKDQPSTVLPRERIVINDQTKVKWYDRIHEYLNMDGGLRMLERRDIAVDHYRMKPFNATRNLTIEREVYASGNYTPRNLFYFAKDLIESGNTEEAVPVFERYLAGPTDFSDNKAVACIRLANYYRDIGDIKSHVAYLRKGMTYSAKYAEFPYMLGDYYNNLKDTDTAIQYYMEAASKEMNAGMSQQADFYEFLPCDKLCVLFYNKRDLQKSLHFCERVLAMQPDNDLYKNNKNRILSEINATADKTEQPVAVPTYAWLLNYVDPAEASFRIRRLNVHQAMGTAGHSSILVPNYAAMQAEELLAVLANVSTVIFSTFTPGDSDLMAFLQSRGKKVVLDYNEAIHDLDGLRERVQASLRTADLVVCCSTALADMVRPLSRAVAVIPDAVEPFVVVSHDYTVEKGAKPVAMYLGMGGNSHLVTSYLRDVIEGAGYDLKVVSEWDNADIKWELGTWAHVLNTADVVLCPQRVNVQPGKSNNKATQAMAMGIPVVASDLPAYREAIQHGVNGYICTGKDQWAKALTALLDGNKRIQVGMNAKETVDAYKLPAIVARWGKVSQELQGTKSQVVSKAVAPVPAAKARETVSVIIPVYNGLEYLKLCLDSISLNTTYPYHVILSDAGSGPDVWEYLNTLKGYTVLGAPGQRRNFSQACNAGIQNNSSKYFVLLNSDVIVSKGWLEAMVNKMDTGNRLAACGVLSNCDRGWLNGVQGRTPVYPMRLEKAELELVPGMKLEQVVPHLDELYQFMEESNVRNKDVFTPQPWVAAYATIYARCAVDEIGLLDEDFQSGCEDLDHCVRLTKAGYNIGQAIDAFVYHFGGISRGSLQREDRVVYDVEDQANHEYYAKKWAKKRIAIYTGPAWEKWDRDTVDKGIGGSETWASELGAEFSKLGFDTYIFNDCPVDGKVCRDGVTYKHFSTYFEWSKYLHVDNVILSRTCEPLKQGHLHAGRISVMIHDVWLSQDKSYDTRPWAVAEFACLSDWHVDFFSQHHGIDKSKIMLTANGVREELYAEVDVSAKKNMAVYSSSADRGLIHLLRMLPRIRAEVPDFELVITYGIHNWLSAIKQRNNPDEMKLLQEIQSLMVQPGVTELGRVGKKELADLQKQAKVQLYPNTFEETFHIGGVENGLALNAVVTTPYAGLLTTLGGAPNYIYGPEEIPVRQWAATPQYQDSFVSETVELLTNEPYRQHCANKVYDKVKGYTWQSIAQDWLKQWGLVK